MKQLKKDKGCPKKYFDEYMKNKKKFREHYKKHKLNSTIRCLEPSETESLVVRLWVFDLCERIWEE